MKSDHAVKMYETIAGWFEETRSSDLSLEKKHLTQFLSKLTPGSHVLDLGCGTGKPIARFLIDQGMKVTAVDGSQKMLELAKKNVPEARLLRSDMLSLSLTEKFDGLLLWHSFFHLPAEAQREMIKRFGTYLSPAGVVMFTTGTEEGEVWSENGGESLYHATLDLNEYEALLADAGFKVLSLTVKDPEAGGSTVWLAEKSTSSSP